MARNMRKTARFGPVQRKLPAIVLNRMDGRICGLRVSRTTELSCV
jgi:hypothetical protein